MLSQVAGLGERYNEWVLSPVDRNLRLFGNPFLESLTITPWYVVPLVWIPIILYFIVFGVNKYIQLTKGKFDLLLLFIIEREDSILWGVGAVKFEGFGDFVS